MRHIPVLSSINLSLSFSLDNCCVGVEDLFGDGEGKFRIHLYFKAVIFFFGRTNCKGISTCKMFWLLVIFFCFVLLIFLVGFLRFFLIFS